MRKESKTNDVCLVCNGTGPAEMTESDFVEWVQCNLCGGWVHRSCMNTGVRSTWVMIVCLYLKNRTLIYLCISDCNGF
jgi:hypothetical protein